MSLCVVTEAEADRFGGDEHGGICWRVGVNKIGLMLLPLSLLLFALLPLRRASLLLSFINVVTNFRGLVGAKGGMGDEVTTELLLLFVFGDVELTFVDDVNDGADDDDGE